MAARTPEDVLKDLVAAVDEAKVTLRELHEARRDLAELQRRERDQVHGLIHNAVQDAIAAIQREASEAMNDRATRVIEQIARDWRLLLGIDA